MSQKSLRWLCLIALGTSAIFVRAEARKDRMVVVISLDGFPAYALDDPRLPIPTLRRLAREGVAALGHARNSRPLTRKARATA